MTLLDFAEFLQVIANQKDRASLYDDENDMSTSIIIIIQRRSI